MITLFSISTCITIHNPKFLLTETPEHEHERRARCKVTTYRYQYLTKHRDKLQITTYIDLSNCLKTMVCAYTLFCFKAWEAAKYQFMWCISLLMTDLQFLTQYERLNIIIP